MNQPAYKESVRNIVSTPDPLAPIREMIQSCIQCGTCTASCPNSFAMDHTPRHLWRMVLMGEMEEIFKSRTFVLCSACYYCTLRCPRGLPLTQVMGALKQVAAKENLPLYKQSIQFYKSFMESVRRHGRVQEAEFMTLYFLSMKDPLLPLNFARLGMRLMKKRKVRVPIPLKKTEGLDGVFRKVRELESV